MPSEWGLSLYIDYDLIDQSEQWGVAKYVIAARINPPDAVDT